MPGVVLIQSDSLRADHLGAYGGDIHTPNLDRFARGATVFERNYAASYPTVPNRLDLFTGRYNFLYRGWTSLCPGDVTLPELLDDHGVPTQLQFDTPPFEGMGFTARVTAWERVRGHIGDSVSTPPDDVAVPAAPHKIKHLERTREYLGNRSRWSCESEHVTPRTVQSAIDWLEANRDREDFFLLVDTWPPHEQFDPPEHYLERYADTAADVDDVVYPMYGRADYMTEAERERVCARYAGEVSMVDAWVGQLCNAIDRLGHDDAMVIFTSDHGHLFGEHGLQGKPTGIHGRLYEESTRTPLFVRHPEGNSDRVEALAQPPDLMPTVLDFFDVPVPDSVQGQSLLPVVTGETTVLRDAAFTGRFPEGYSASDIVATDYDGWAGPSRVTQPVTVTTDRWTLVCHPDPERSELYDLDADPNQTTNVFADNPDVADRLRDGYCSFAAGAGAESEMRDPWESAGEAYEPESLATDESVYRFRADGRSFAFLGVADARARRPEGADAVDEVSFSALLEENPEAFVCLNQQYYYARDLR
jgi:arylsulfatase A-like enzyme